MQRLHEPVILERLSHAARGQFDLLVRPTEFLPFGRPPAWACLQAGKRGGNLAALPRIKAAPGQGVLRHR